MAFRCCLSKCCVKEEDTHGENRSKEYELPEEHSFSAYEDDIIKDVRIAVVGKTGSGKSSTCNTILGGNFFRSEAGGASITSRCCSNKATRFGRNLQVVDTPGVFDTNTPNEVVQEEICKCIGLTSPGPHCILLVLGLTRFTKEEKESIDHFIKFFGNNIFRYFIFVFTRKDDLDYDGKTIDYYINNAPENLKEIVMKCNHRYIAFNNRAQSPEKESQVKHLLKMIDEIVRHNNGTHYTNEMYIEAEKILKLRQEQIEIERKRVMEKKEKEIERKVKEKYKDIETQNIEKEKELQKLKDMHSHLPNSRDEVKNEVENKSLLLEYAPQILGTVVPYFVSCLKSKVS